MKIFTNLIVRFPVEEIAQDTYAYTEDLHEVMNRVPEGYTMLPWQEQNIQPVYNDGYVYLHYKIQAITEEEGEERLRLPKRLPRQKLHQP